MCGGPLRISSLDGQQARNIEGTVDTGASFTTLPSLLLRELGIEATGKRGFLLADGRRVEMDYGQAWATIDGESVVTIVVFGEDEAPPLLGAYALEGLALAVDPEAQRVIPTHMILYWDAALLEAYLFPAPARDQLPGICERSRRIHDAFPGADALEGRRGGSGRLALGG